MVTQNVDMEAALGPLRAMRNVKLRIVKTKSQHDGDWVLTLKAAANNYTFTVIDKKYLTAQTLGMVIEQIRGLKDQGMIFADYVNPKIAARLRELDIPFADRAGNIFLNAPPAYLFVIGNRPRTTQKTKQPKPFHAAALKVLFPLLCQPELVTKNLRELARYAGVALGTAGNVIKELRNRGHIIDLANGTPQLVNLKPLLEQWLILYPTVLRPKYFKGCYRGETADWWTKTKRLPEGTVWGGEVAAAMLTEYLKPITATIFAQETMTQLLINNRLREDTHGNTEIIGTFWNKDLNINDKQIAPPLLIYTELMVTGDPRNLETAKIIYDNHLARHFGKTRP